MHLRNAGLRAQPSTLFRIIGFRGCRRFARHRTRRGGQTSTGSISFNPEWYANVRQDPVHICIPIRRGPFEVVVFEELQDLLIGIVDERTDIGGEQLALPGTMNHNRPDGVAQVSLVDEAVIGTPSFRVEKLGDQLRFPLLYLLQLSLERNRTKGSFEKLVNLIWGLNFDPFRNAL